jgi:hypothetical protein
MAKIFSQLEKASLENLAADPAPGNKGRIFINSVSNTVKFDDGTAIQNLSAGAATVDTHATHFAEGEVGLAGAAAIGIVISPPHYVPSARTISVVRISAEYSGSAGTTTVQLYKNGAVAGSTASLGFTGAAAGSTTTLGTTFAVVAGDLITAQFTALATAVRDIRIEHN